MQNFIKPKGFTLIELLVVVAIIGILAAVGVIAYNGYMKAAKINASRANHSSVCKWVNSEVKKIELGVVNMFGGNITTTSILDTYNADGNPMGTLTQAIVTAASGKFSNPYGSQGSLGEIGVTSSGWGKARDLGHTIIDPQGPHNGKLGHFIFTHVLNSHVQVTIKPRNYLI